MSDHVLTDITLPISAAFTALINRLYVFTLKTNLSCIGRPFVHGAFIMC